MIDIQIALPQILEGIMLACFGFSWPFSIYKTWKLKRVDGKSIVFLSLVFIGYVAGVVAKLVRASFTVTTPEVVTILYAINGLLVAVDISLYIRYRKNGKAAVETIPVE